MSKIILYIASSLDGFIARKNGSLDWLHTELDYGYKDFLQKIGITFMGNNTYQQVLAFGEFPYPDKTNYVFTRNTDLAKDNNVTFISGDIAGFSRELKEKSEKYIWLIGGSEIIDLFLKAGLVDELILFIMPVMIGGGIPLFLNSDTDFHLNLLDCKSYSDGMVQLKYEFEYK